MTRVGLTGGAGSGKSEAADMWRALGAPVLCADDVARRETEPPSAALDEIRAAFGARFFTADGRLNRRMMRGAITRDKSDRQKLEAILHPLSLIHI